MKRSGGLKSGAKTLKVKNYSCNLFTIYSVSLGPVDSVTLSNLNLFDLREETYHDTRAPSGRPSEGGASPVSPWYHTKEVAMTL